MPARMLVREGVVEPVAQHAVVELPVAHAVTPAAARDQVRRQIHVLHSARNRDIDGPGHDLVRRRYDRLGARAAHAVHRHGRNRDRQAGAGSRLAGGVYFCGGPGHGSPCPRGALSRGCAGATGATCSGSRPARSTAAPMTTAPRSGAGISLRLPPYVPIAVRTGAARTTSCEGVIAATPMVWANR